ncbi:hypothetical protein SCLCIDRAFT_134153 [Scleroderma citrinum Foug A]|uniref:F-box domain-containing protein n=1 Tax=Scleroderma citrinum Foug A TaxID=1036808 RepID=A0A0C2Z1K6_9AGAM|nr:hypothetical protein SCLCIDRAFT_134153 [Scleroderma citrinum Foug A]
MLAPGIPAICTRDAAVDATARSLPDLPPELWIAILRFTDTRTILRCTAVCRSIRAIIDDSVELQYRIELTLDGMIDGPPSPVIIGDRLARLRALRRAWATLDWSSNIVVPMPGPCHAYELVGGVFCKTHHSQHHRFSSRHLTATWLPSSTDPAGRLIDREDIGLPTRDFAIDPSQDLIILFKGYEDDAMPVLIVPGTLELHIRTLSTNEVHPEARLPKLSMPVFLPVTGAYMAIVDDVVGMLYCVDPERPHITLWNWKTGKVLRLQDQVSIPAGTWDFSFISNRSFFVTSCHRSGSIEIFTFEDDDPPTLAPPSTDHRSRHLRTSNHSISRTNCKLAHVASLHLPPTLPHIQASTVHTHTGPFVARPLADRPFAASNEERVHVLAVQYLNPNSDALMRQIRFCVFLKNKVLEEYVKRHKSEQKDSLDPMGETIEHLAQGIDVPWDQWGRENTRYILHNWISFDWLRYVHGNKVVLPWGGQAGNTRICVLDFNVQDTVRQNQYYASDRDGSDISEEEVALRNRTVAHASEKLNGEPQATRPPEEGALDSTDGLRCSPAQLITEASVVERPLFFPEPFETTLPYRMVSRMGEKKYSGVMLDEERIVGVSYPASPDGDMKDIHVFTM